MKKNKILLFIIMLGLIFIISACASKTSENTSIDQTSENTVTDQEVENNEPLKLTLAGYAAGGSAQIIGEAFNAALGKEFPGSSLSYEPGQGGANEITVSSGKTELGFSFAPMAQFAIEGKPPYDKTYSNLKSVMFYGTADITILTSENTQIKSLSDIASKKIPIKIAMPNKNSMMEIIARSILEQEGISYDNINSWGGKVYFQLGGSPFDMMRDKKLDLIFRVIPTPASDIVEASTVIPLRVLEMSDNTKEKLKKEYGGVPITLTKDNYSFLKNDIKTIGIPMILISSQEVPEDTMYKFTKAVYNQRSVANSLAPSTKVITNETIKNVGNVPLHPGAEKFYKEVGILK